MHIVATVDGFPIEVQVRTYFQDAWANQTEALADEWGRGIRYGLPPNGDSPEQVASRLRVLALNESVSDRMRDLELAIDGARRVLSREVAESSLRAREELEAYVDRRVNELLDPSQKALENALSAFLRERQRVG